MENSPRPQSSAVRRFDLQRLQKEIKDLLNAKDGYEFERRLNALGQTVEERTEIRRLLGVDRYLRVVSMITEWCPSIEIRIDLLRRLCVATFGSDGRDLSNPDAAEFAVRLIVHPSAPDLFVHGLAEQIVARGQSDRVNPILAAKWLEQNKPARDFIGMPRRIRHVKAGLVGGVMPVLAQRKMTLTVVIAFVLLAPLVFVLGRYSFEEGPNSGENQVAPSAPPGQSETPVGQNPAKRVIAEMSIDVTTNSLIIRGSSPLAEGRSVFLLLRTVGEKEIYPQGECAISGPEWTCTSAPLTRPETGPSRFEVLVVDIPSQLKQSYQKDKPLENPPDPDEVIFKIVGLA